MAGVKEDFSVSYLNDWDTQWRCFNLVPFHEANGHRGQGRMKRMVPNPVLFNSSSALPFIWFFKLIFSLLLKLMPFPAILESPVSLASLSFHSHLWCTPKVRGTYKVLLNPPLRFSNLIPKICKCFHLDVCLTQKKIPLLKPNLYGGSVRRQGI